MSVSNSTNYSQNAGSIIRDALIKLGSAGPNSTISDATNEMCRRALNRMIKSEDFSAMKLWIQGEGAIVFDGESGSYLLPSMSLAGQDVGVCRQDVLIQTTISADEASGQTVLSLTDTTGMAATNKIMIELDDGTRHDTTIVSVDSSTQVTITSALADDAASGNFVYVYPVTVNDTNFFYARSITNVRLRDSSGYERELFEMSRSGFEMLFNKAQTGTPSQYYYDPQLNNPVVHLYPIPDDIRYSLRFTYTKALDDVDALTDDLEFPQEWLEALVDNLAYRIAPQLGKEDKVTKLIAAQAAQSLRSAQFYSGDQVALQVQPNSDMVD